jgi:hypothetical protein
LGTRYIDQISPNLTKYVGVRQDRQAASNDVWINHEGVISDWGLGETDMWARLVMRHDEMLATGGVSASLWLQLNSGTQCTCLKAETGQFDQRCPICYGARFIGGYEKFGHQTLTVHAGDTALTLTDTTVQERRNPYPIVLSNGKTTGTILTPEYAITDNYGFVGYDLTAQNHMRDTSQSQITVEYTVDGGLNWVNIASSTTLLNEPSLRVQFRVTMTRATATASSPFFQILRARWKSQRVTEILISKNSFPDQRLLESMGVSINLNGVTWWTTPNLGIVGGANQRISEEDLFEIGEGIYQPEATTDEAYPHSGRFKPSTVMFVEPTARFISQRFNLRNLQRDEPENSIF